ncbi:hypothetical protein [Brevundimonas variabilis]|uniref:Uncharacterized protein n=1 Tax=Brevundimonas variabilis TaxID=74312 RepID=A0A7W9CKH6_9CAUL|nr:hypothetical protein [Brevundimonas variabilis]MBB5746867.1 hypothetical protein [Brevundimonas variabilis]
MTGNTDRDNEIWLEAYMTTLKGVADESLGHLAVRSKTPADTAEIDRRARAIYNLARAARMVAAARRKPGTRVEDREDEMRDDDDPDESRAEARERIDGSLRSRLEHVRAWVERGCLDAGLERPHPDGGYGLDPGPS